MGVILSKVTGALFEYVHFCTERSTWTFIKVKRVFGLFANYLVRKFTLQNFDICKMIPEPQIHSDTSIWNTLYDRAKS